MAVLVSVNLVLDSVRYLLPALGVSVNVYGPAKKYLSSLGIRSAKQALVSVEVQGSHVARVVIGQALVLGRHQTSNGIFHCNHEGIKVQVQYDETVGHELLMIDPACTLSWMPYTPHTDIPSGAVIGGHSVDGTPTYVAKVHHTHDSIIYNATGYYNPKTGMAYAEVWGAQTTTDMMILILL